MDYSSLNVIVMACDTDCILFIFYGFTPRTIEYITGLRPRFTEITSADIFAGELTVNESVCVDSVLKLYIFFFYELSVIILVII